MIWVYVVILSLSQHDRYYLIEKECLDCKVRLASKG